MLELTGISRSWRTFALRDISLRVKEAEYFVLLGPSGAGKSLLLELIAGFHTPDRGGVLLDGRDVTRLPPEKRQIGFVYQDSLLFPHKSPRDNIAYGLRLRGKRPAEIADTVARLARMLHIERILDRDPERLSGGERQRVSIARALAIEPRLLLLDEPLGSLDPLTQGRLRSELRRVHRHSGVTVVHVTHDQTEARHLGQRIAVMRHGRLLQVGAAAEVFEKPSHAFVAEFTGCRNVYEGHARSDGGLTVFRSGALVMFAAAPVEGAARAVIRPENVIISTEPVRTSARNQLGGRVTAVEQNGIVYEVTADVDGQRMTSLITGRSVNELGIRPGTPIYMSFKANSLHLIPAQETDDD